MKNILHTLQHVTSALAEVIKSAFRPVEVEVHYTNHHGVEKYTYTRIK